MKGADIMANRTVNTNQLAPGTMYMVRGKVSYSRMLRKIDGEELKKDNDRRRASNRPEATKPYTTITIKNAQVVRTNPNAPESLAEIYARESLYTNKNDGSLCLTIENKGREPWFARHQNDDITNPNIQQFCPTAELAAGMDVTFVMEVYQAKPNNGVGLQGIIMNEPVKYFMGNGAPDPSELASLGLTFTPASAAEMSAGMEARKNMAPVGLEETDAPVENIPNSASAPVTPPVGDPYSFQPTTSQQTPFGGQPQSQYANAQAAVQSQMQAQQPTQTVQAQSTAPQQGFTMPTYTDAMPPFNQQTLAQQGMVAQPQVAPQQNIQPGIRYTPDNRNY